MTRRKEREKEGRAKRWEGGASAALWGAVLALWGGVTQRGIARWLGVILQFWKSQIQGKDRGHLSPSLRKSIYLVGDAGCGKVRRQFPALTFHGPQHRIEHKIVTESPPHHKCIEKGRIITLSTAFISAKWPLSIHIYLIYTRSVVLALEIPADPSLTWGWS
jgi:hypothetical protein